MTAYNRGMQHISSHWQKMLVGFDGSPESLNGVAQLSRRTRNPVHRLFQGRHLAMGRAFLRFDLFLKAGRTVAKRHGRAFDLNMLRQCLTLGLLDRHGVANDGSHFLIIGDGYAAMSSIIMEAMPRAASRS